MLELTYLCSARVRDADLGSVTPFEDCVVKGRMGFGIDVYSGIKSLVAYTTINWRILNQARNINRYTDLDEKLPHTTIGLRKLG